MEKMKQFVKLRREEDMLVETLKGIEQKLRNLRKTISTLEMEIVESNTKNENFCVTAYKVGNTLITPVQTERNIELEIRTIKEIEE